MAHTPTTIGRYTVRRVLGRGGMGTVYLAVDPLIERDVAIKVLPAVGGDGYEERLLAEARVSGRLVHPNIVGVFDIGDEQGQPFVVMPYVEGRTLAAILADATRPAMDIKLEWMIQLCEALAYAHERRVIHRDIKPSNLLIDERGALRVLDFGIAKVLTTSQIQFTSVGTPAYMAPEQYSSEPVDPRTDVFAAGLVLYEVITHRRALTGTTPAQIYGQLMAGPLPRVADAAPDVAAALAAVCERAMSRDPRDRFQTARAFGAALADARTKPSAVSTVADAAPAPDLDPPAPPTASTITPPPAPHAVVDSPATPSSPAPRRWRALAASIAAAACIGGAIWSSGMWRSGSGPAAPITTDPAPPAPVPDPTLDPVPAGEGPGPTAT
jgi:eukaryotic-like serine/threonine-protein kinase